MAFNDGWPPSLARVRRHGRIECRCGSGSPGTCSRSSPAPPPGSRPRLGQGSAKARGEAPWMAPALRSEEGMPVRDGVAWRERARVRASRPEVAPTGNLASLVGATSGRDQPDAKSPTAPMPGPSPIPGGRARLCLAGAAREAMEARRTPPPHPPALVAGGLPCHAALTARRAFPPASSRASASRSGSPPARGSCAPVARRARHRPGGWRRRRRGRRCGRCR